MISSPNIRVLGARLANCRITMFANMSAGCQSGETIRNWLTVVLGASLAGDISKGFTPFSDWESLSVFQGGDTVPLDTRCSTLRADSPVICILRGDDSLPAEIVAKLLLSQWDEQRKDEEANELAKRLVPFLTGQLKPSGSAVPTSQERHWLTPQAVLGLKRFFYQASDLIGTKLRANPTRREEGLTNELVFEIFSNSRNRDLLRDLLAATGVVLELSCEESGSAERVLGSDLGMCLSVRGPGLFTRRAILLQAKRLQPAPDEFSARSPYGDLLETDGIAQAQRMLGITPCSYFLLYNPAGLEAILAPFERSIEIRTSLDYSTDGICILPALIVEGLDKSTWQAVVHLHPFTCSFVKFMVDDFIQGKVGDRSKRALLAALTRKLRPALELDADDDDTPPPRFSVTLTLDITEMPEFRHPDSLRNR